MRVTFNQRVDGSIPSGLTNLFNGLSWKNRKSGCRNCSGIHLGKPAGTLHRHARFLVRRFPKGGERFRRTSRSARFCRSSQADSIRNDASSPHLLYVALCERPQGDRAVRFQRGASQRLRTHIIRYRMGQCDFGPAVTLIRRGERNGSDTRSMYHSICATPYSSRGRAKEKAVRGDGLESCNG